MAAEKTVKFRRVRIKRKPFPKERFILFVFLGLLFGYFIISILNEVNTINVGGVTSEEQDGTAVIRTVIEINNAEYLNSEKKFINDITDEIKNSDNIWSGEIHDGEYIRVIFEEPLTKKNDITIYPRIILGNSKIEIYEKDKTEKIAEFASLNSNQYNKIFLDGSSGAGLGNKKQDTFDLKVVGGSIEFEHVIDPMSIATYNFTNLSDRVAWKGYPTAQGIFNQTAPSVNLSTSDYTNIQTGNTQYASVWSHGGGDYPFFRFNFTVLEANNSRNAIQWLFVNVTGYDNTTGSGEDLNAYMYNFSSSSLHKFATLTLEANEIGIYNYTGNINATDFIRSSTADVVVYIEGPGFDTGEALFIDFVQVDIGYYIDTEAPQWFNPSVNDSTPNPSDTVKHNINWTDDSALSFAILEINSSGVGCDTTANITNTTLSGVSSWANLSWTIPNACEGKTIAWRQYANDTASPAANWNMTSLQTYNVQNVAPTVTLPVYTNATKYKNTQSLTFNISVVDVGIGAAYCSVNVNGNSNQTLAVSSGWCNGTYALTGISDGNKTINAYANDTANNFGLNNSYVVWIDTTPPTITLPVYTNLTAKKSSDNLLINVSVTDSGVGASYCRINVATATVSNVTVAVSNGWCNTSYSLSGTSEGNQIINAYANDTLGNIALNNSYAVKIDNTPPTITLPLYTNATFKKNTETLTLNISISDSGSGTTGTLCLIDITGTNQSITYSNGWCNSTSISLTGLTDGNKTIKVYANDTANNFGLNNSYVAQIDSTIPQIQFISPTEENATSKNQQFIFASISLTETNFKNITYRLQNSSGIINQTTYTTAVTSINWTNLNNSNVQYWYNVSAYDQANNFNITETRYITLISNQAPQVTLIYPQNTTYNVNVSQLNYSATDDSAVSYCWYSLNGGTTNSSPDATCSNFTGLTSNQGSNTWVIYANDSSGATNSSNITFFKDTIFPQFTNYQRNISSPNEDQAIQINITITETNKNYTILEFKGTTNYTVTTNVSDEYYFTIKGGNYTAHDSVTYYWYANDSASNMNKSSQQSFTVANQIPSVSAPAINDTTPETNDMISCNSGTFSDNDAEDTEQARYFKWYDNDIEISGQASQILNLSVSGLDKTGIIKCSVRIYDGYDNSSWTNSSNTATIQNTAPVITNPLTTVSWNANGSTFTYDYDANDADDDSLTWYDNTTLFDINSATGAVSDTPTESEVGTYAIRINVSDGAVNTTDDFTYTINDVTYPLISFTTGTENNATTFARNWIFVNVTVTETNEDTITFSLYNQTHLVNQTRYTTGVRTINWTSLPAEIYRYNVTINDTTNNQNSTETRQVSLSAPTLNITNPENKTYITGTNVQLNFTVSLQDYILYNLDGTGANTTITGNITFDTTSGLHTLYLFANNSIGTTSKNVTFTVNLTKFIIKYGNYSGSTKGNSTNFNASSYEDLQNLAGVILENTNYGKIRFYEPINLTDDFDFSDNSFDVDTYTNISSNFIEINSTALPNLNTSATLYLYGLSFSNPRILRDGSVCPDTICTKISYSGGTLTFNVTQFTTYSAEETPAAAGAEAPSGGGGEEPGLIPECTKDSECALDEVCLNYQCVKLFDIKIIDFESPAQLGEFFDFTYYIKGVAKINADVEVRFWIEKDGEVITSGSDTIYLGDFEERTETTKIFLPSTIKSGIYEFYIEVVHPQYSAQSHRTIEIQVKKGVALVGPVELGNIQKYIIMFLISLSIVILGFIVYHERKKIRLGLIQERRWFRKHKISVLTASLVLVGGLLLYFSGFFKFLAKKIVELILWIKINLPYFVYGILIFGSVIIIISILKNKKIRAEFRGWRRKRKIEKFFKRKYTRGVRKAKKDFLGVEKGISKRITRFSEGIVGFSKNFINKLFSGIGFLAQGVEKDIKKIEKDSQRIIKKTEKEIPEVISELEKESGRVIKKIEKGIKKTEEEVPEVISELEKEIPEIKISKKDLQHFISVSKTTIQKSILKIKKFFKKFSEKKVTEKPLKEVAEKSKEAAGKSLKEIAEKSLKGIEKLEAAISKEEKKISEEGARFIKKTEREGSKFAKKTEKEIPEVISELDRDSEKIIKDAEKGIDEIYEDLRKFLNKLFGKKTKRIIVKDFKKYFKKNKKFVRKHLRTLENLIKIKAEKRKKTKKKESDFLKEIRKIRKGVAILIDDLMGYIKDNGLIFGKKEREELEKIAEVYNKEISLIENTSKKISRKTRLFFTLFRKPKEKSQKGQLKPEMFEEKAFVPEKIQPEEIQPEEIKEKKDKDIIFDIAKKEKKQKESKPQ